MKIFKIMTFSLALLTLGVFLYKNDQQKSNMEPSLTQKDSLWHTFKKDDDGKIEKRKSTAEELKNIDPEESDKIKKKESKEKRPHRKMASVDKKKNKNNLHNTNDKIIFGRSLMGSSIYEKIDKSKISFANEYNEDWKKNLANGLLRFQNEDVKVLVKKDKSVVKIQNDIASLYEIVTITYSSTNSRAPSNSFNALIDSETGKVQKTWNQSIHEPLRGHRMGLELSEPGKL